MARIVTWAYGVTTIPDRFQTTLPRTLVSLEAAGFGSPHLFIDGPVYPRHSAPLDWTTTCRSTPVRTAGNWHLALLELYHRQPSADWFALFQDDMVTYKNLRTYLQRSLVVDMRYYNLHTFLDNEAVIEGKEVGWHPSRYLDGGQQQTGRSALGLVFSQSGVIDLLSHRHLIQRAQDVHRGWKRIDGGIVTAMNELGYKEMIHNPSLLLHTGVPSSIGNSQYPEAKTFRGETFDALRLLDPS